MDFIFITIIILWVLTEAFMFLLKNDNSVSVDDKTGLRSLSEFDIDGNESINSSTSSSYEGDSGIAGILTESSEAALSMDCNEIEKCTSSKQTSFMSREKLIEKERQKKQALAKRLARQERDRKQLSQFLQSKHKMDSQSHEEGYETDSDASFTDMLDLLFNFVQYIRKYKIILLEEMSLEFKLRPQEVANYMKDLQSIGIINGVMDDRGRFIYVAETESNIVANFIQQQHLYHWPRTGLI